MSDFTKLNAAMADLSAKQRAASTAIKGNDEAIKGEIDALTTALTAGAGGTVDRAAVDAALADIVALSANNVNHVSSVETHTEEVTKSVSAPSAPVAPTHTQAAIG